jgi:hypothetical protein
MCVCVCVWGWGGGKWNWWSMKDWWGRMRRKIGGDKVEGVGHWEKGQKNVMQCCNLCDGGRIATVGGWWSVCWDVISSIEDGMSVGM